MPKGCSTQSLNVFQRTAMAELGTVARHVQRTRRGSNPYLPGSNSGPLKPASTGKASQDPVLDSLVL